MPSVINLSSNIFSAPLPPTIMELLASAGAQLAAENPEIVTKAASAVCNAVTYYSSSEEDDSEKEESIELTDDKGKQEAIFLDREEVEIESAKDDKTSHNNTELTLVLKLKSFASSATHSASNVYNSVTSYFRLKKARIHLKKTFLKQKK